MEEIEGEKVKVAECFEEVWQDVWSPDYGWVQALENKRPRDGEEEGNTEAKVRKGDGKANKGGKAGQRRQRWKIQRKKHLLAVWICRPLSA